MGKLVAGGLLDEAQAVQALTEIAEQIGLGTRETARTIQSGLAAGRARRHGGDRSASIG